MTTFRSGFTLWKMVHEARELTEHPSVTERVDAVLDIMGPAWGDHRRRPDHQSRRGDMAVLLPRRLPPPA
ncbi:hypothetical protein [Streptomyces sp. NPDC098101]|uniref:hypothetical protein n=1 Tax=Streptomyces sp. NPDC098101 TaxID=3366096 RepID=UPI0037FE5754